MRNVLFGLLFLLGGPIACQSQTVRKLRKFMFSQNLGTRWVNVGIMIESGFNSSRIKTL
jgi:hypothetical protein